MKGALLVALPGNDGLAAPLARALGMEAGGLEARRFPDGESYLRFEGPVEGRTVVLLCTLDRPDDKILTLLFAADTARALGAAGVGLIAPYLAYMRQDRRFKPRESVTSAHFARLLCDHVDWLATVDPHLHRRHALEEIYTVPARAAGAAPLIAEWIGAHVPRPVLIGPDEESEQWVASVARATGARHTALRKVRRGDRDVEISVPDAGLLREGTPVLVDDIISTGRTMIETIRRLLEAGAAAPVCAAVHGVFAGNAYKELLEAGAAKIVTSNTIPHESNGIDVSALLAESVRVLTD